MEISYLQEFVQLAQSCKFQETAEKLFISQSTLSKHIHLIEKELGADLFVRSTRHVELSDVGKAFLSYATQITLLQQDYTDELIRPDTSKTIRIGTDSTISLRQIEKYFSNYIAEHPSVHLILIDQDKTELRGKLRSGDLDIIIAARNFSNTDSEFCSYPYYDDRLTAVMSSNNPLYNQESVTIEAIKKFPLAQKGEMNFANYLDPTITSVQYLSSRSSFITQALNKTNAICICPSNVARSITTSDLAIGLKAHTITPEVTLHVDLIYPKTKRSSPFIQSLLSQIKGDEEVFKS